MKQRLAYGLLSAWALFLVSCHALARTVTVTNEDGTTTTTTVGDTLADGMVASSEGVSSFVATLVAAATGNPVLAAAASAGTFAGIGALSQKLRPGD